MRLHEHGVDVDQWHDHVVRLTGQGVRMVDFLTAVDHPDAGRIEVVAHLVDPDARQRHLVRTSVDRTVCALDSLVDVLPGVAWHEREVHEMFGVRFRGNPDLRPLLTTGEGEPPLRRTTPLPARLDRPWPGARDPADRPAATGRAHRPRSAPITPGVPSEWPR